MEKSLIVICKKQQTPIFIGLVFSVVLLLSWIFQLEPLRDAVNMLAVSGFRLEISAWYIILAPLMNILDVLSFCSASQHQAVIAVWLVLPCLVSLLLLLRKKTPWLKCIAKLALTFTVSVVFLLLLYVLALLLPRPMGALVAEETDVLLVDFHSHTNFSWDANSFFTAKQNRLWHEKAGFDAAFITDHLSFAGVQAAKQENPTRAGDGLLLLAGLEEVYQGVHVLALCADTNIYEISSTGCQPLFIQANPSAIERLEETHDAGRGVLGVEIHDAAPVGLETILQRDIWLAQAEKFDVAVVYGSDNHGWAYAASAWSVLRIPDWRDMDADALELAITQHIRNQGFAAVQVVERNLLLPASSWLGQVMMPAQLLWRMLCVLSPLERLSWWLWCCFGLWLYILKKDDVQV
ncbi:MAG: hypothetical protein Q9M19_04115 [Mariprofundaceae bacterium]|nr:hypothetical protein [Mariprofundaceae bacterium]